MAALQQQQPVPQLPVLGRPQKWRVLGVLTGPTADAIVEGDQRGLGAIEEIFELPGSEAEVRELGLICVPWGQALLPPGVA